MTDATPLIPNNSETSSSGVKVATPDLIVQPEAVPIDALGQIYFENLAGHEIINIARSELVNGINVSYALIGNLNQLKRNYNSANIFSLPETIDKYFKNFAISFDTHVPEEGSGPGEIEVTNLDSSKTIEKFSDIPRTSVVKRYQKRVTAGEILGFDVLSYTNRVWLADKDYPFADSGDIIVEVTNMEKNEVVEVEILNNGALLSDTIYEGES